MQFISGQNFSFLLKSWGLGNLFSLRFLLRRVLNFSSFVWSPATAVSKFCKLAYLDFLFCKVHIFWEGHKILQNLHHRLVLCTTVKSAVEISQNFVFFSEYMNFTNPITTNSFECDLSPYYPSYAQVQICYAKINNFPGKIFKSHKGQY